MIHELKIWPDYFERVISGEKKVEIRRDDRDYGTGDTLHLKEWDPSTEAYTGRSCDADITHMLRGPWLADGHVALSISLVMVNMQRKDEQGTRTSLFERFRVPVNIIVTAILFIMITFASNYFVNQSFNGPEPVPEAPTAPAGYGLQPGVIY